MSGFTNVVIWQPGETLEQLEERVVKAAVDIAEGKKDIAAKALGISLQTVYNHLDRAIKRDKGFGDCPTSARDSHGRSHESAGWHNARNHREL